MTKKQLAGEAKRIIVELQGVDDPKEQQKILQDWHEKISEEGSDQDADIAFTYLQMFQARREKRRAKDFWWVPLVGIIIGLPIWFVQDQCALRRSPGYLVGNVIDPPGAVHIILDGSEELSVRSEKSGFFRIDEIPPGDHEISCSFPGFESYVAIIEISGGVENGIEIPSLVPVPPRPLDPKGKPDTRSLNRPPDSPTE